MENNIERVAWPCLDPWERTWTYALWKIFVSTIDIIIVGMSGLSFIMQGFVKTGKKVNETPLGKKKDFYYIHKYWVK